MMFTKVLPDIKASYQCAGWYQLAKKLARVSRGGGGFERVAGLNIV
jgi:hypothetical protein